MAAAGTPRGQKRARTAAAATEQAQNAVPALLRLLRGRVHAARTTIREGVQDLISIRQTLRRRPRRALAGSSLPTPEESLAALRGRIAAAQRVLQDVHDTHYAQLSAWEAQRGELVLGLLFRTRKDLAQLAGRILRQILRHAEAARVGAPLPDSQGIERIAFLLLDILGREEGGSPRSASGSPVPPSMVPTAAPTRPAPRLDRTKRRRGLSDSETDLVLTDGVELAAADAPAAAVPAVTKGAPSRKGALVAELSSDSDLSAPAGSGGSAVPAGASQQPSGGGGGGLREDSSSDSDSDGESLVLLPSAPTETESVGTLADGPVTQALARSPRAQPSVPAPPVAEWNAADALRALKRETPLTIWSTLGCTLRGTPPAPMRVGDIAWIPEGMYRQGGDPSGDGGSYAPAWPGWVKRIDAGAGAATLVPLTYTVREKLREVPGGTQTVPLEQLVPWAAGNAAHHVLLETGSLRRGVQCLWQLGRLFAREHIASIVQAAGGYPMEDGGSPLLTQYLEWGAPGQGQPQGFPDHAGAASPPDVWRPALAFLARPAQGRLDFETWMETRVATALPMTLVLRAPRGADDAHGAAFLCTPGPTTLRILRRGVCQALQVTASVPRTITADAGSAASFSDQVQ